MFTTTDAAIVAATFLGPVVAVQLQKYLERWRDERDRRTKIFKKLMATRKSRLASEHIEALNMIDLEFPSSARKFRKLRNAWKAYRTHLGEPDPGPPADAVFYSKRDDLFLDMLYEMGQALGYDFDKTQIGKDAYSTVYHERVERDQEFIRTKLVEILNGKAAFPMAVVQFPNDPEFLAAQTAYMKLVAEHLGSGRPWPIAVVDSGKVIPMRAPEQKSECASGQGTGT